MKKIIILGMFALTVLMFGACTKAKDGAPGTNGTNGVNGANGVANISTRLYTVTPGSWSSSGSGVWTYSATDLDITDFNVDAVMVYYYGGSSYFAIPATSLLIGGDNLVFSFSTNQINLIYLNSTAPTITTQYKVVVIPPAMKKPNIDYKNYAAVKAAYNLID
jgi:hypothetical protein